MATNALLCVLFGPNVPGDQIGEDLQRPIGGIIAATLAPSGGLFAAAGHNKHVYIWSVTETLEWTLSWHREIGRRATALLFGPDEKTLLVADKSGDVIEYDVLAEGEPRLLLGHVSMLLDMTFLHGKKLLATCDRDEKIRVSNYPNAYNIHTFCLGHKKFVNRVLGVEASEDSTGSTSSTENNAQNFLVSTSGDGTVSLWDSSNGVKLQSLDCDEITGLKSSRPQSLCYKSSQLFVSVQRFLLIFRLHSGALQLDRKITLDHEIADVICDLTGRLWLLQASAKEPLTVLDPLKFSSLTAVEPVVGTAITAAADEAPGLAKAITESLEMPAYSRDENIVDNTVEYLERKKARIESQSKRFKRHHRKKSAKKSKTKDDGETVG